MSKKRKRFLYSVVEEAVLNPEFYGYAGGRIEMYDAKSKDPYPSEYRFLIPEEMMEDFRKWIDFQGSDKPVYIMMNTPIIKNKIKKGKDK